MTQALRVVAMASLLEVGMKWSGRGPSTPAPPPLGCGFTPLCTDEMLWSRWMSRSVDVRRHSSTREGEQVESFDDAERRLARRLGDEIRRLRSRRVAQWPLDWTCPYVPKGPRCPADLSSFARMSSRALLHPFGTYPS
jgi:hypothetical protein